MSVIGIRVAGAGIAHGSPNPVVLTATSCPPIRPQVFEGPVWQAECLCPLVKHDEVPYEKGTCGLYAHTNALVEVRSGVLGSDPPVALSERPNLARRQWMIPGVAIVVVECLGRTVWHDNGVLRSATQVPLEIWLGPYYGDAIEPLSRRYQCPASLLRPGRYLWSGGRLHWQPEPIGVVPF